MRLSEAKVNEVRQMFKALAEQQADMFCTTFESFAQQLPTNIVSEEHALQLFDGMLSTVKNEYEAMVKATKESVDDKLADADFMKELLKGVKHE